MGVGHLEPLLELAARRARVVEVELALAELVAQRGIFLAQALLGSFAVGQQFLAPCQRGAPIDGPGVRGLWARGGRPCPVADD